MAEPWKKTWAQNREVRDIVDQWAEEALAPKVRGLEGRGFTAAEERDVHRAAGTENPPTRKREE